MKGGSLSFTFNTAIGATADCDNSASHRVAQLVSSPRAIQTGVAGVKKGNARFYRRIQELVNNFLESSLFIPRTMKIRKRPRPCRPVAFREQFGRRYSFRAECDCHNSWTQVIEI
jgi:hypothetical protein